MNIITTNNIKITTIFNKMRGENNNSEIFEGGAIIYIYNFKKCLIRFNISTPFFEIISHITFYSNTTISWSHESKF